LVSAFRSLKWKWAALRITPFKMGFVFPRQPFLF
jgi:hypothetical protein